jgi:hypothetical protein
MIQELITYTIILLATVKLFYGTYQFFFSKKKNACGCSSGACHGNEWNHVQHQAKYTIQYIKK